MTINVKFIKLIIFIICVILGIIIVIKYIKPDDTNNINIDNTNKIDSIETNIVKKDSIINYYNDSMIYEKNKVDSNSLYDNALLLEDLLSK